MTSGLDANLGANTNLSILKDENGDKERNHTPSVLPDSDPFNYTTNDPRNGYGYDICIECTDLAPFPSAAHLRAAEEHLQMLDTAWAERCRKQRRWSLLAGRADNGNGYMDGVEELPVRPPPNANAVIHLPFPSSPLPSGLSMNALVPVVKFLERVLQVPFPQPSTPSFSRPPASASPQPPPSSNSRRWSSSVSSLLPSIQMPSMAVSSSYPSSTPPPSPGHFRTRSFTYSNPHHGSRISAGSTANSPVPVRAPAQAQIHRSRPLKILIYSSDGYTESSVPALCLLMAVRRLSLPEAYLELQVVKKRSFFVYQGDLGTLRKVESRLCGSSGNVGSAAVERGNRDVGCGVRMQNPYKRPAANSVSSSQSPLLQTYSDYQFQSHFDSQSHALAYSHPHSHSESESESEMPLPPPIVVPSQRSPVVKTRPRASTSPWLPSLFPDHQAWFDDPRFDGSFPSRVLPFLYLGNL
jgi:dual specificity MAP kinase phosphatase